MCYSGLSHRKRPARNVGIHQASSHYDHGRNPPTSKATITTILPSKVENSPLKEQMDSKLDPARLLTTTTPRQPSGVNSGLSKSFWGLGTTIEIAESYRNQIGNTLAEKMFADYQYKKVLSAGEHKIDGKTIQLKQDFYATVKEGDKASA